jgi:hypothetical protein
VFISQKTAFFTVTAVKASNLTQYRFSHEYVTKWEEKWDQAIGKIRQRSRNKLREAVIGSSDKVR